MRLRGPATGCLERRPRARSCWAGKPPRPAASVLRTPPAASSSSAWLAC